MKILFGEFEYEPGELFDGMGNEITIQTPHALDYVSDAIRVEIDDFRKHYGDEKANEYDIVVQYAFVRRID